MTTLAFPRSVPARSIPARTIPARTMARATVRTPARPAVRWLWHQRSIGALLGLIAVTISTLIAVLIAALIGPFIVGVLPFILLMGFAIGPLHAMIRGEL